VAGGIVDREKLNVSVFPTKSMVEPSILENEIMAANADPEPITIKQTTSPTRSFFITAPPFIFLQLIGILY
jgi:hypothetical protein